MNFYFTVHLLLGLFVGSIGSLKRQEIFSAPLWIYTPIGTFINRMCNFACYAAIITTFINYTFAWSLATAGEIALGALISGFLIMPIRAILALVALVGVPAILGTLWGFWYL